MNAATLYRLALGADRQPDAWQSALATGAWPRVLTAPTGSGKTAAVTLGWAAHRLRSPGATPRRLVWCLPMRTLVEQTADAVREWFGKLAAEPQSRGRLPRPQDVHILMGGADADGWLEAPERPAVVVGTQDMLLSRALMRGYASSRALWPMEFALLHEDAQWVFDEVQLMGAGRATSAQLEAFRQSDAHRARRDDRSEGTPSRSLWLSATLDPVWLATVDHPALPATEVVRVDPGAAPDGRLARLAQATKRLARSPGAPGSPKKADLADYIGRLADAILEAHRPGRMTLAIVNRVDRAQALRAALEKKLSRQMPAAPTLALVHSRFRPADRAREMNKVLDTDGQNPHGRIVVATQAVEAGMDISAAVLFTELAPWSSLVQRFGRANRYAELPDGANVHWIDLLPPATEGIASDKDAEELARPYEAAELQAARDRLSRLNDVAPVHLPPPDDLDPPRRVIRRKDLDDLFDTDPDLTGFDVDVSPYVRDADDTDIRVFWRNPSDAEDDPPRPGREELCAVSIGTAKTWISKLPNKGRNLLFQQDPQWRRRDGQTGAAPPGWMPLQGPPWPGLVLLADPKAGGYRETSGFTGDPKDEPIPSPVRRQRPARASQPEQALAMPRRVSPGPAATSGTGVAADRSAAPAACEAEGHDEDPLSGMDAIVPLADHLRHVASEAESLCAALDVEPAARAAVVRAARWHDLGKAHDIFQDTMRRGLDGRAVAPDVLLAKTVGQTRHGRAYFRHELASALAFLAHERWSRDADLVAYLIAAHHGKVRMNLRALPREAAPRDGRAGARFARGVWEGDPLPAFDLEGGEHWEGGSLLLSIMELGWTSPARAGRSARASCSPGSVRSGWRGWRPCCGWPTGGRPRRSATTHTRVRVASSNRWPIGGRPRRSATEAGMTGEPLALHGCTPTPLASYLKALGVLRLVSSPPNHVFGAAADPHARGWWENECFHLRTALSRDALLHFFLHDYAPSPIIAPWNGRAGFLEGGAGDSSSRGGAVLMRAVENSECRRLGSMRRTVNSLRKNGQLGELNRLRTQVKDLQGASKTLEGEEKRRNDARRSRVEKEARAVKSLLLPSLRSETGSQHVGYIDTCYVLSADEAAAPLLGSGGVDGSRDFGVNFADKLQELIDFCDGSPRLRAVTELEAALFDVVRRTEGHGSMGQFGPGQGGPNATTGYEGYNPLNAWDVVLAMEGTLTFAGALTRRWGATSGSRAAFPFTFEPTGAGTGSLSSEDPNRPRGEVWTPIWPKPATFAEAAAIFAEGRLTLGERIARTGLDAARSVARIGAARGIGGFERYSIIQPDAKMPYQATPLGRFDTPDRPRRDLVADLEAGDWLSRARRLVGNKRAAPARARQAMRRLEDALFQMTVANLESDGARNALVALGSLVDWLASNPKARKDLRPPPLISHDWIREADDGSAEFHVAAAVATIGLPSPLRPAQRSDVQNPERGRPDGNGADDDSSTRETPAAEEPSGAPEQGRSRAAPPMAAHLAPLDEKRFFYRGGLGTRRAWHEGDTPPTLVWGAGDLVSNLIAVLERRLVEASIRGLKDKPLAGATTARLADVAAFVSGGFDDARCAALLAGLVWARPTHFRPTHAHVDPSPVPFAYAALKPLFTPDATLQSADALPGTTRMPVPPGLIPRLRVGGDSLDGQATDSAVHLALARARASGLPTPFDAARSGVRQLALEGGRMGAGVRADRLAAALLIPIGDQALTALLERAYPGAVPEDDDTTTEDTTNAP